MITGEGLITGYTAHEALHKVVATGCRTMRSVQPNLSRDLDGFVQRLVATERSTYRQGLAVTRSRRPSVWTPGEYLVID